MAGENNRGFWGLIGKISAVVILISGLIGLAHDYLKPTPDLAGELTWSKLVYPDTLLHFPAEIQKKLTRNAVTVAGGWTPEEVTSKDARARIDAISEYLEEQAPRELPYPVERAEGFWSIDLKNKGSLAVDDVTLVVPRSVYVRIQRENETPVYSNTTGMIKLDKLRPGESASVVVWSAAEPTEADAPNIRLSHSLGIAKLEWKYSVGVIGHVFENAWRPFLIFVLLFGFCLYGVSTIFLMPWQSPPNRAIRLEAKDAERHGGVITYESDGVMQNIGYWNSINDYVTWKFYASLAGTYEVIVEQSCQAGNGGEYSVEVGNAKLTAIVQVTGAGTWLNFVRRRVGQIAIPRTGMHTLRVSPVQMAGPSLMNLRMVFLIKVA